MQIGIGISLTGGLRVPERAYSAEALAAFAAMSTPPSRGLKVLYDDCILSLKAASIWTKLDALYLMGVETAQAARVNIKNPGTFDLTAVSGPVFTAKQGYQGDGSSSYLDTNFNPTTAGSPNWSQNSAMLAVWPRTAAGAAGNLAGSLVGATTTINTRNATDQATTRVNNTTVTNTANTDGANLAAADRTVSTGFTIYKGGASLGTSTEISVAVANDKFGLLLTGGVTFSAKQLSIAAFGASLTAGQHTSFYNALNTFKTGAEAL